MGACADDMVEEFSPVSRIESRRVDRCVAEHGLG